MAQSDLQKNKRRKRFFRYAPLVFWIGLIFFLSSNSGSMSNTSRFVRPILMFLFPTAPEEVLLVYHGYVRKMAHLTEYAILAFWASRAFYSSSVNKLREFWYIAAFIVVLTVAALDETNQSFSNSRTGSPIDVLIDCASGLLMILLFAIIQKLKRRPNRKYLGD